VNGLDSTKHSQIVSTGSTGIATKRVSRRQVKFFQRFNTKLRIHSVSTNPNGMSSNQPQQQVSMASTNLIWFQLVDAATGAPYMGKSPSAVSLPSGSALFEFQDAVKAKYFRTLESVEADELIVYMNKDAFDKRNLAGKEAPLHYLDLIASLGSKEEDALIVVVPASIVTKKRRRDESVVDKWYRLVDAVTGEPYPGTSADIVIVESSADVADFRHAVKENSQNDLASIDANNLLVYPDQASFDSRNTAVTQAHLDEELLIGDLGASKAEALIIAVPRREVEWIVNNSIIPQFSYNQDLITCQLDTPEYLGKTGVVSSGLVLYCRPSFHDQFQF
jgi:hypothetical protein